MNGIFKVVMFAAIVVMVSGICVADSDSDILQFAKGVAASDSLDNGLQIFIASNDANALGGTWRMGDYDTNTPEMINAHLGWILGSLVKVTTAYPTRFHQISGQVYDKGGNLVGKESIAIGSNSFSS